MRRPKGSKNKSVSKEVEAGLKAEEAAARAVADQEYPFLKEPAEPGAVIIDTDERESTRPMTEADIKEAHDDLYKASQKLRAAADREKDLTTQEKNQEAALKGTREALREAEQDQLMIGRKLATLSEEIHTGLRKIEIKVVESITKGNEYIVTDARNGAVLERRTATADEIEEASGLNKPAQTAMSTMTSTQAADDVVLVSLAFGAYDKAKRGIKDSLLAVPYPNAEGDPDGEIFGVVWSIKGDRSVAEVPRWVADRLKKIADGDKRLDFKIGDLAKLAEKLESKDGVVVEVLKQ